MTQNLNSPIRSKSFLKALDLIRQKKYDAAEEILLKGVKEAEEQKDAVLAAVYYSTHGLLCKLKKDFRNAWKSYEKAEKLIPEDPALKIISSRLLVDYFGQYDTVIKKIDKVISQVGDDLTFLHQAYTLQGLAYLGKGNKDKAVASLKKSMGDNFKGLQTSANLDYQLVGELIRKKKDIPACRDFLNQALLFAKSKKEKMSQTLIEKMLAFLK